MSNKKYGIPLKTKIPAGAGQGGQNAPLHENILIYCVTEEFFICL